jgi:large subunit ribosomal protein L1
VTRAHPQLIKPEVRGIRAALARVLEDAAHRQRCRDRKAIRNHNRNKEGPSSTATAPAAAAASSAGPFAAAAATSSSEAPGPALKVVDETIELALNLNLDPRKPNQSLRGSVDLPHGSGKSVNCLVFTSDPDGAASLRDQFQPAHPASASSARVEVGGEDLVDRILAGEVSVERFERGLATPDMQKLLGQRLARILGPRGLMPNPKAGTLVEGLERLREALGSQVRGRAVPYRTDREGVVHVRLGRASFGADALVENAGAVLKEIFKAKPDQYGKSAKKGKKSSAGKNAKYLLRATVTSTQGKGYSVDVRTLDPTSPFFLNRIEGEEEAEAVSPPAEEASREPAAAA